MRSRCCARGCGRSTRSSTGAPRPRSFETCGAGRRPCWRRPPSGSWTVGRRGRRASRPWSARPWCAGPPVACPDSRGKRVDGGPDGPQGHDMHLELSTLDAGLDEIRQAPADAGTLDLIVRRPAEGERDILAEAHLDTARGLVGDRWLGPDAEPDRQITVMNRRGVALPAGARGRLALAGEHLYLVIDLTGGNLPPRTRPVIGAAGPVET